MGSSDVGGGENVGEFCGIDDGNEADGNEAGSLHASVHREMHATKAMRVISGSSSQDQSTSASRVRGQIFLERSFTINPPPRGVEELSRKRGKRRRT